MAESKKGVKVTVVDLETGDTEERVVEGSDVVVIPIGDMYLDSHQAYGNGTQTFTFKRVSA